MTDSTLTSPSTPSGTVSSPPTGAGQLLRQYREAAGLHVVAMAAALKVTRAKIECLEAERYEELPDVAFARALAMSCCRYLGKDSEPVLALMPSHAAQPTPGLRQHVTMQGEPMSRPLSRPRFNLSRGPFASPTVPPWMIWVFVIAVIVVGGWFAASPQRVVVKAPASALDIPPQGVPGAEPVVAAQEVSGASAAPAGPAGASITGIAPVVAPSAPMPATGAVESPPGTPLSTPAPITTPALRIEPVTPSRR